MLGLFSLSLSLSLSLYIYIYIIHNCQNQRKTTSWLKIPTFSATTFLGGIHMCIYATLRKDCVQLKIAALSTFSGQLASLLGVPLKRKKQITTNKSRSQTTHIQRIFFYSLSDRIILMII